MGHPVMNHCQSVKLVLMFSTQALPSDHDMMIERFLSGHCQTIEIFTKYQSVEACTSISALWSLPNLIDINWNQDFKNISQLEHVPV